MNDKHTHTSLNIISYASGADRRRVSKMTANQLVDVCKGRRPKPSSCDDVLRWVVEQLE